MNERRKHQAECGADESMYVHSERRKNLQSKPFYESRAFTLLPQRPRSYGDVGLYSRSSELLGLQVQGFCCPLQQRPSTGRSVTPQSREGRDGGLTLLSSPKGKLEGSAKPAARSRTGSGPEMTTEETWTPPCDNERHARQGQPGATKVSELHLYLPSSLCDDEEQDAKTEEMRTSAEDTSTCGPELNNANSPVFINPSHTSQDQGSTGPGTPRLTF